MKQGSRRVKEEGEIEKQGRGNYTKARKKKKYRSKGEGEIEKHLEGEKQGREEIKV